MRRFEQVVKYRIWWRNVDYRSKNMHLIWSPSNAIIIGQFTGAS